MTSERAVREALTDDVMRGVLVVLPPPDGFAAYADAVRERLVAALAAARGEPGLREALDAFFEDVDADWSNDNIRPGDFAFRFRHAADRLRAALATPTTPEPEGDEA